MSANLKNTTALLGDAGFRARVTAAMTEMAASVFTEAPSSQLAIRTVRMNLATAVIADAAARVDPFARLCADDDVISAVAVPAEVPDAEIRRVVAIVWNSVAAAIPNLGR